jgi:hypothetical protein
MSLNIRQIDGVTSLERIIVIVTAVRILCHRIYINALKNNTRICMRVRKELNVKINWDENKYRPL